MASVGESVAGLEDGSAEGKVDWPVGGSTEATGQLSGCKESISTGQVGSTCSCVESTMT